jgi:hypothetical protein
VRDPPIGRPTPPSDQSYRAIAERALVENGATQTDEIAIDESDLIEIDTMNEVGERAEQSAERAERESSQELIRMAERLDGVDPRFVRAAHALETDKRTKGVQKDSHGQSEDVEDIDPKLLRAAAKAKDGATADGSGNTADDLLFDEDIDPDVEEKDEDDWRERLEQSNSNDIISFLPLPIAEDPDDILEE